MNTGKEYNDIMHKISKGNIVDGKEDMYSTFKDGSLNNKVKDALSLLFVEAKWYKNFILDYLEKGNKLKDFDTKIKTITHKDKDKNDVEVELKHLSSQMRSGTVDWIQYSLNALHAKKLKGQKVGKLKHCKYGECNHVGLRSLFDFLNKIYGEKI